MIAKEDSRVRWDKPGIWDKQIHTAIYKIDKQQELTMQHKELYSLPGNNL